MDQLLDVHMCAVCINLLIAGIGMKSTETNLEQLVYLCPEKFTDLFLENQVFSYQMDLCPVSLTFARAYCRVRWWGEKWILVFPP